MIRGLHLHNFKCFQNQELRFGDLTLLSGLNGMGKSSVLQSLLLLRQSFQQDLLQRTGLMLNGELVKLGTAQDVLFEGAMSEESLGFDLDFVDSGKVSLFFKSSLEADVLDYVSDYPSANVFRENLFNDNFYYLQAERIGPRAVYEYSDYLVRRHHQLGPKGEYTAHFLALNELEEIPNHILAHPQATSFGLRDQVEAWLSEISPGARIELTIQPNMDLVSLRYSFVAGKQVSKSYRSTNVGFGLTYTLPILVALLSASPGSLVLLENPEAHLHPQGQSRLGHLIALTAACGVQVILETHSDHILNGIRLTVRAGQLEPENTQFHFFGRQDIGGMIVSVVSSPKVDRNGRIDHWPDGFFDAWDKDLEALLD